MPAIHYGQIHTTYGLSASETISHIDTSLFVKSTKAHKGDLVIATTSEDDEMVANSVAWHGESEVAVSGDAVVYKHQLEPNYVAHFFRTESFASQKRRYITGIKVRRISSAALAKIEIPVPPLAEQRRIADILDRFDTLVNDITTGLPAELEARRKQYAYYRDKLLTFKEKPADPA